MEERRYSNQFFNIKDTLECGQIFRFKLYKDGYLVLSKDKACYAYADDDEVVVVSDDPDYFENYFDIATDYSGIYSRALKSQFEVVRKASFLGKGIRILRQDREEMFYSFLISQNNHIPRIKSIIERLCKSIGEKKTFDGEEYYTFPSSLEISAQNEKFFSDLGFGYRSSYMVECSKKLVSSFSLDSVEIMSTPMIKKHLMSLKGVGPKEADCIALFGFHRTDSFPVDTWIEKLYREDFNGEHKDRNKITDYFLNLFGGDSGYVQQYIFYYKRSLEERENLK